MFRSTGVMNTPSGGSNSLTDKLSEYKWSIILGVIALIGLVLILYYYVFKPISTTPVNYSANSEHDTVNSSSKNSKDAEIMFFYVDWCPHCKTAKPAWNDVKSEYENKTINGYKVIFTEINCTEETAEVESLMNKYNIEGFPTIKLLKDGQVVEYDAKPTKDTLTQFLNTVL
jgi:thiol-disulfide isomerase/thioredoxin